MNPMRVMAGLRGRPLDASRAMLCYHLTLAEVAELLSCPIAVGAVEVGVDSVSLTPLGELLFDVAEWVAVDKVEDHYRIEHEE